MIIKGKLKIISGGTGQRGSRQYKYDFVEIGDYTINNVTINGIIHDRLTTLFGQEIEVSVMKRFFIFPKSIVAVRTQDGRVFSHLDSGNDGRNLIIGKVKLGLLFFMYLLIPYGIVFSLLAGLLSSLFNNETIATIIVAVPFVLFHRWLVRKTYNHLIDAVQVFGKSDNQTKVI